ncbi:MAG: alpha/beta hydrolase [Isosphaeraceae bacterium]|nr:alpha/beta hydrolase [Isosphaeraceae bacterium]
MVGLRRGGSACLMLGISLLCGRPGGAAEPASRVFDAREVKIHYVVAGEGEPVVLIHGLHSSADVNWRLTGVFGDLARNHQVIALDLPGHGRSDKPEGDDAYGLQLVDDVVLLLDHLRIRKAHVVGYSVGGMVAAKLLATHPERVSSGLIGGMGWFREGSGLQRVWERMGQRDRSPSTAAFLRGVGKLALTEDELKRIKVPVEVLVGDRDPINRMYVAPLRPLRHDWPVVEIEDAGHINCIMKPQFREAIAAWVGKNTKA